MVNVSNEAGAAAAPGRLPGEPGERSEARARVARGIAVLAAGTVLSLRLTGSAFAAPVSFADNLECREIRDSATHQTYKADFASNELARQDGCTVRVPAKQVCWAVLNDGLAPPPFGAPAGPNLNGHYYLCYQMICPRDETEYVLADKLGGARYVKLKRANRICVPGY